LVTHSSFSNIAISPAEKSVVQVIFFFFFFCFYDYLKGGIFNIIGGVNFVAFVYSNFSNIVGATDGGVIFTHIEIGL
jgi:hypothetical protein